MAKHRFLEKHRIKRNAIKEDILFFGIPGLLVFTTGLVLSAMDGYDGLVGTIWNMAGHPRSLGLLSAWNIAGLTLFVVGLTFAVIAVCTLKRFYSSTLVTRKEHQLITHGVYRYTRHPIYLGVLMACMAPAVYAPSLYGFLTMLVLIPIFLNRIRMEEKMLTEEFGDAYRIYKEATSKLIPFI